VQIARALADRLPATAEALSAGDIFYRHAAAVLVHGSADLPASAVAHAPPDRDNLVL